MKIIIIGCTTGVIEILKELAKKDLENYLIISAPDKRNIALLETDYSVGDMESMDNKAYTNNDLGTLPASESFLRSGMIVAP